MIQIQKKAADLFSMSDSTMCVRASSAMDLNATALSLSDNWKSPMKVSSAR